MADERKPKELNTLLKTAVAEHGKTGLSRAWRQFLLDPYGADRGWPLELFISKIPALLNSTPRPSTQPTEKRTYG